MASFDDTDPCLSTEWKMLRCPGVVVYDDSTFPISSQQDAEWTALDDGQGPSSQEEEEEEEQDDCRHLQPSGIKLSIECVDNAYGRPGVIVQEDKTFPISSQQLSVQCSGPIQGGNKFTFPHQGANQKTASGDDPHSSVKPNASPNQEEQDTAMEWESTASQSLASQEEEEEEEEEEQDDCRHLQPSGIKISGAIKCVNESTFSVQLSVQCSGPIQGGNKFTFPLQGANQKTASGDDPRSSVKPNASPNQEEQDTAMEWESTASQSLASNVAPSVSTTEETPMEVD